MGNKEIVEQIAKNIIESESYELLIGADEFDLSDLSDSFYFTVPKSDSTIVYKWLGCGNNIVVFTDPVTGEPRAHCYDFHTAKRNIDEGQWLVKSKLNLTGCEIECGSTSYYVKVSDEIWKALMYIEDDSIEGWCDRYDQFIKAMRNLGAEDINWNGHFGQAIMFSTEHKGYNLEKICAFVAGLPENEDCKGA